MHRRNRHLRLRRSSRPGRSSGGSGDGARRRGSQRRAAWQSRPRGGLCASGDGRQRCSPARRHRPASNTHSPSPEFLLQARRRQRMYSRCQSGDARACRRRQRRVQIRHRVERRQSRRIQRPRRRNRPPLLTRHRLPCHKVLLERLLNLARRRGDVLPRLLTLDPLEVLLCVRADLPVDPWLAPLVHIL